MRQDESYKRHVGPVSVWDKVRARMTPFLVKNGLRPDHTLLDVGCGTMRNALPLIEYLDRGNYFGIDSDGEAIEAGIENEIPKTLGIDKAPRFREDDTFDIRYFGIHFDWVFANAVFIHCGHDQLAVFLWEISRMVFENKMTCTLMLDVRIGPKAYQRGVSRNYAGHASHQNVSYTPKSIRKLLDEYDGKIIKVHRLEGRKKRRMFHVEFKP